MSDVVSAPAITVRPQAKPNDLQVLFTLAVSPKKGFEQLGVEPRWGWAMIVGMSLTGLGFYLQSPAIEHILVVQTVAQNPKLASMSPEQLSHAVRITHGSWLPFVVSYLKGAVIDTVVMVAFAALSKGKFPIRAFWAASVNITALCAGLGTLVTGAIVYLRGPNSFQTASDLRNAMPSLAWIVHVSHPTYQALASFVTPFTVWGWGLEICAMIVIAGISPAIATITTLLQFLYFSLRTADGWWMP